MSFLRLSQSASSVFNVDAINGRRVCFWAKSAFATKPPIQDILKLMIPSSSQTKTLFSHVFYHPPPSHKKGELSCSWKHIWDHANTLHLKKKKWTGTHRKNRSRKKSKLYITFFFCPSVPLLILPHTKKERKKKTFISQERRKKNRSEPRTPTTTFFASLHLKYQKINNKKQKINKKQNVMDDFFFSSVR